MAVSDASQSASTLASWNEDGQLYLVVGIATSLLSWLYLPLAGLLSVYCGYGLWSQHDRSVAGGAVAAVGGVGFAIWIGFLASLAV